MTRLEGDLHRLDIEPVIRSEIFFEDLRELLQQLVLEVSVDSNFMILLKLLLCDLAKSDILAPATNPFIYMD